jgi:hypothetical protein
MHQVMSSLKFICFTRTHASILHRNSVTEVEKSLTI